MPSNESLQEVKRVVAQPHKLVVWFLNEVRWLFRVIISSGDRFYWDNGFSKAASLAYTSLLSLVPMTALGIGVLGSFAVNSDRGYAVTRYVFMLFVPSHEAADTVIQHLSAFSETMATLNVLVIGTLIFTALLLLNSIEYVLNEIWQVFEPRSWSHRFAIYCAIMVTGPVLALSAYYTNFSVEPYLAETTFPSYLNTIYNVLWPFLIDYSAFLMLYYLVPKAPVMFSSASLGAFLGALLFDLAKKAFVFYIATFSSYEKIYGTLAAIPIFLFWLYLAWSIVLFGAECCYQAQYLPKRGQMWKHSVASVGDAKLILAMQALVMIARAFMQGVKLPNELDIAVTLGCSSVVLKPALHDLEKAGIIARGDSRDMPLTLMRHPDTICLEDLRHALFEGRGSVHFPEELERLFGCLKSEAMTKGTSLAQVLSIVPKDTPA